MISSATALLQDTVDYLLELVFKDDANVQELLTLALAWSVFWFVVLQIARRCIAAFTYGKPWLRAMCEREYERNKDPDSKEPVDKEQVVDNMMKGWAGYQAIMLQHVTGSMLCIPALLWIGDPSRAASLAILGLMCEMGWEIEDFVCRILYIRLLTTDGEKKVSTPDIIFSTFHHGLTCTLALPMALHYRSLRVLHWLIFDLQAAGAFTPVLEYGKTLDIKQPKDLKRFKLVNLASLLFFTWTRFLHFLYLVVTILCACYHDKAWGILALATVPLLAFCALNYLIVSGTYKRYKKFNKLSAEFESLPADAPEATKRESVARMVLAASEMNNVDVFDASDVVASFLESLDDRDVRTRRWTLKERPTWGSTRKSKRLFRSVPAVNMWKED